MPTSFAGRPDWKPNMTHDEQREFRRKMDAWICDLRNYHTRELMKMLRIAQATTIPGYLRDLTRGQAEKKFVWEPERPGIYQFGEYGPFVTKDEIKAELAKREHIPNKREARELRKERIKRARGNGRRPLPRKVRRQAR